MVNIKSAITFGLFASTATAASLNKDKRHVHHRRAKAPCTTSSIAPAPFPIGNSTVPAGTGVVSTSSTIATSTSKTPVTYTVVPVPINPTPSAGASSNPVQPSSANNGGSSPGSSPNTSAAGVVPAPSGGSGSPSPPAGGSACGAATSYVTVQQTITVTAGQTPEVTSSSSVVQVVVVPSTTTTPAPKPTEQPSAPALLQTAGQGPEDQTTTAEAPVEQTPTSSSSAPAKPSGGAVYTGTKRGVAYNADVGPSFDTLNIGPVAWMYDWHQSATVPAGTEYIPTVHDAGKAASFAEDLASQSGITWVKHLNEGDMPVSAGGCALSPSDAASVHKQYIAPLQGQYQIGFPAVSSDDRQVGAMGFQSGITWLEAFIAEAGCDFAFGDAHWYGWSASVEDQAAAFLKYVDEFTSRLDKACPGTNLPVWFTEFAAVPTSNTDLAAKFMAIVAPELEKNTRVARYSPFVENNVGLGSLLEDIASAVESLI